MKRPNLFIVGQPKSGTSALHTFLEKHPGIFMSRPKEPAHFGRDLHEECNRLHGNSKAFFEFRSEERYLKLFLPAEKEKIAGESSTIYLYSKSSAKEIHEFNPTAKIIVMLREPVSFLHSLHMQYVNNTSENESDFRRALEAEEDRKRGTNIPERVRCPSLLFYSERAKYTEQIQRYLGFFPREQIKIIIFEDFKRDNTKVYKEVLEFLGVDSTFKPDFKRVHESKASRSKLLNNILRNPHLTGIPKSVLPARTYDRIRLKIQDLLMKQKPRPPLDPEFERKLKKKLKPEVRKLSRLVGRDLVKEWEYD